MHTKNNIHSHYEENANTKKILLRSGGIDDFLSNRLQVNINVSDICNFSCSYCINPSSKIRRKRILSKKILAEFIEDISKQKKDFYQFNIAGGEPLLYPHIEFLIKQIQTSIKGRRKIALATNGSLLLKQGERIYAAAGDTQLEFSVSVHMEQIILTSFAKEIKKFGQGDDLFCKILVSPGMLSEIDLAQEI